jgi:hypothetical protein
MARRKKYTDPLDEILNQKDDHHCWKLYRGACAVYGEAWAEAGALFDDCETIWAAKKAFRREFGVRP